VANALSYSGHQNNPTLGIATFVGNLILMVFISAGVRTLVVRDYPLAEILLFRYLFACGFFWIILLSTIGLPGLATKRYFDHFFRSTVGILSLGMFYFAVTKIPLADATAIAYAAPIFISVLAIFLLGEKIGVQRWVAVVAGFIGVLLIARPVGTSLNFGVVAAVASAFTGALVAIWLRKLSSSEKPVAIGTYYNSLGSLICLFWVVSTGWLVPHQDDFILLTGFGLMCGIQQWCLTISFRYAEASLLAPFEYLAMVFAAIAGFLLWDEVPVLMTWIGAAVIAASGLFIFMRRQKLMKTSKPVEPVVIE
jgi:drug/metabolite transporter (DMT)-like permease